MFSPNAISVSRLKVITSVPEPETPVTVPVVPVIIKPVWSVINTGSLNVITISAGAASSTTAETNSGAKTSTYST